MWTSERLQRIMTTGCFRSAEEAERDEIREKNRKQLDLLRKKLDRLLDKKDRMIALSGARDLSANEWKRSVARERLYKTKAWKGNEYDIEAVRREMDYIERNISEV